MKIYAIEHTEEFEKGKITNCLFFVSTKSKARGIAENLHANNKPGVVYQLEITKAARITPSQMCCHFLNRMLIEGQKPSDLVGSKRVYSWFERENDMIKHK